MCSIHCTCCMHGLYLKHCEHGEIQCTCVDFYNLYAIISWVSLSLFMWKVYCTHSAGTVVKFHLQPSDNYN